MQRSHGALTGADVRSQLMNTGRISPRDVPSWRPTMLVDRVRMFILSLLLLLAGCGGGGGNPGTPGTSNPPPTATTGSLQVAVTGLPTGLNAAVRITGPNNFSRDLAGTQT